MQLIDCLNYALEILGYVVYVVDNQVLGSFISLIVCWEPGICSNIFVDHRGYEMPFFDINSIVLVL